MSKSLLEAYKNRINVANAVYAKSHGGETMDNNRKVLLARCLENTRSFLKESIDASAGTQRADMGLYKKFCTNLINVAIPNLIAPELVITKPMSSMSGYITYIEYSASTNKGETAAGTMFNSPFALNKVDANYTGEAIVETFETGATVLAWTPCLKGGFKAGDAVADVKLIKASDGTIIYGTFASDAEKTGTLTGMTWVDAEGSSTTYTILAGDKIAYRYDNVVIPQADLPRIKAEMKSIPLVAKARRVAIYYSQIAAFQAQTDYGFDLGDQLAEQACGRLQYEIDTEVIDLLDKTAGNANADLQWDKTLPVGVSKTEHYQGFAEAIEVGKQLIYDATQRFVPNYMVCASNIIPVLAFINGWKPAGTTNINGPYFAGTLNGIKVFVSPALAVGRFLIGVNGNDYMSSVAAYCPYMPLVPTQLLQFADGATSQGFSTLYDLVVLNKGLICAGQMTGTGIAN